MIKKINSIWYLLIGIILMALSHMTFSVNLIAWISYTPFLIYLKKTKGIKSRLLFVLALVIGWSIVTSKIITPPLLYIFVFLYSVPITIFHLPGFILWDRFKKSRLSYLIFPSMMTIMEWIQYTFTPFASWGTVAYTQIDTPSIMQSLSLFGIPGLSFLIYWINISIAELISGKRISWGTVQLPAIVLIILVIFGSMRINLYNSAGKDTITVAAIGTDSKAGGLPLPTKKTNLKVKADLFERTRKAACFGAKLAVWTEAATYVLSEDEQIWKDSLSELTKKNRISLFASYVVPISLNPLQYENKFLFIDSTGNISYEYNKHEPVPGEPAIRGIEPLKIAMVENSKAGGVICYDYDFPYLAKGYGNLGADIVAVPSSDWRGIDPIHTKMAAFRAVEQGHSIIRSTRFGLSAAIDPYGQINTKMSSFDNNNKIMIAQLPIKGVTTVYAIIGDSFIFLCIGFIIAFIIMKLRNSI